MNFWNTNDTNALVRPGDVLIDLVQAGDERAVLMYTRSRDEVFQPLLDITVDGIMLHRLSNYPASCLDKDGYIMVRGPEGLLVPLESTDMQKDVDAAVDGLCNMKFLSS